MNEFRAQSHMQPTSTTYVGGTPLDHYLGRAWTAFSDSAFLSEPHPT
jgi:hypothetical protein